MFLISLSIITKGSSNKLIIKICNILYRLIEFVLVYIINLEDKKNLVDLDYKSKN